MDENSYLYGLGTGAVEAWLLDNVSEARTYKILQLARALHLLCVISNTWNEAYVQNSSMEIINPLQNLRLSLVVVDHSLSEEPCVIVHDGFVKSSRHEAKLSILARRILVGEV